LPATSMTGCRHLQSILVQRRVALIIVLDTLAANARTGPRPPDRIHNTISLRLFPWDGQQKDGRRYNAIDLRLRPVSEIINNGIHECWLDA
jgi:hypothetical protein